MIPPCAKWEIWSGEEIEGTESLGEKTRFIRKLEVKPQEVTDEFIQTLTRDGTIKRIWFCKEFTNWDLLRSLAKHFEKVCLEVESRTFDNVPRDIKMECTLYFKLNFILKSGDFVCVGPPYQDEAFKIGEGKKVQPEQYLKDVKVR